MTVIITFIYRQATSTRVAMDGRNVPWSSVSCQGSPQKLWFSPTIHVPNVVSVLWTQVKRRILPMSPVLCSLDICFMKKKVKNGCRNIQPLPWPLVQCQGSFVTSLSHILNKLVQFYLLFECLTLLLSPISNVHIPKLLTTEDPVKTPFLQAWL